jgi:hypothetical protein
MEFGGQIRTPPVRHLRNRGGHCQFPRPAMGPPTPLGQRGASLPDRTAEIRRHTPCVWRTYALRFWVLRLHNPTNVPTGIFPGARVHWLQEIPWNEIPGRRRAQWPHRTSRRPILSPPERFRRPQRVWLDGLHCRACYSTWLAGRRPARVAILPDLRRFGVWCQPIHDQSVLRCR